MTYKEALEKRNSARARRKEILNDVENPPVALLNADYDWGYWDAVVTIMNCMGWKEIENKAVQ